MARLAIIPARGGSKRIPRKNIKDFCGKPMITHVLDAANQSGIFDKIHVSTDDMEIASVAAEAGFAPDFMRDAATSDDYAPIMAVLQFVVRAYEARGEFFDTVTLLYATTPLLSPTDLIAANEIFEKGGRAKPLMAITPYPAPIEWAFRMEADGTLKTDDPAKNAMRSQDLKPAYYDAAMFTFYSGAHISQSVGAGDYQNYIGYEVPSFRVTEIDNADEWDRAEKLFKAQKLL